MSENQIHQVRSFNRSVTQRIGALRDSYLDRGRPLGEARLIHEIGSTGVELRSLRDRLGLDSGYLSRLLRSVEAQGLITMIPSSTDRRRRRVALTRKGRAEHNAYERLSNQLAETILAPLSPGQRTRLAGAMAEVERLLGAADVTVAVESPATPDARRCLDAYFAELAERFDTGFDPARSNPASEADMSPPAGYFVIARLHGDAVGCGALKCGPDGIGEIKRMWSNPAARGLGVARRVLRRLEKCARDAGLTTLRLETNRTLIEAQGLYCQEGYREVAAFNAEPYAHHWFEKALAAQP